jgi:hypothetical protein
MDLRHFLCFYRTLGAGPGQITRRAGGPIPELRT